MRELSIDQNLAGREKEEKERIRKEINSVHVGYSDKAIRIKSF